MELGVGAHFKKWEKGLQLRRRQDEGRTLPGKIGTGHIYQGNESMRKHSVLFVRTNLAGI